MQRRRRVTTIWLLFLVFSHAFCGILGGAILRAQTHKGHEGHDQPVQGPVHISMEELHKHGGVPPGWQFRVPAGSPTAGREAFVTLRCHSCHTVTGESFPPVQPSERSPAPDLAGMGALHPVAYLAESILNPNAVIVTGPGYMSGDGLSIMTDYSDLLTVRQLLDLVAYIQSLRDSEEHHRAGHSEPAHHATPATGPPHAPGKQRPNSYGK
jgi:mono/diheme cytochrome c family protein